jgi:hypothetical protein
MFKQRLCNCSSGPPIDRTALGFTDLGISESTVKSHVTVILTRLNVSDRTEAIVIGLQRGLVHL